MEFLAETRHAWLEVYQKAMHITVDCTGLHYLSTAGAQLMLSLQRTITQEKKTVQFINIPERTRHSLDILGLSSHFPS
jgi:anti-anti-sigma regulatory factor